MKVLIVEDERTLALEMEAFLKDSFYSCDIAFTAKQALKCTETNVYEFVLLDLGLPDRDGLELLKEIKEDLPDAAYIIVTARGQLEDRIKGLDLGADDYLSKPFSLLELNARMQAIKRRKFALNDTLVELNDFQVDLKKRMVYYNNAEIELSKKEFDILSYLVLHKNKPITRVQISEYIWGNFSDEEYDSNYIDVHIKNIRKKLSAHAPADFLETVRGVGYKIKI